MEEERHKNWEYLKERVQDNQNHTKKLENTEKDIKPRREKHSKHPSVRW